MAVKGMADGRWWDLGNHVEEVRKAVAVVTALAMEVVSHQQERRRR